MKSDSSMGEVICCQAWCSIPGTHMLGENQIQVIFWYPHITQRHTLSVKFLLKPFIWLNLALSVLCWKRAARMGQWIKVLAAQAWRPEFYLQTHVQVGENQLNLFPDVHRYTSPFLLPLWHKIFSFSFSSLLASHDYQEILHTPFLNESPLLYRVSFHTSFSLLTPNAYTGLWWAIHACLTGKDWLANNSKAVHISN